MFSAESPLGSELPDLPPPVADAGRYASLTQGFEHGLVVLSMGLPYWLEETADGCELRVEAERAAVVRRELAAYDHESSTWPPVAPVPAVVSARGAWLTSLLWVGVVVATFQAQLEWPGRLEAGGALDPAGVLQRGEWWRLGTALFLHADIEHVLANVVIGFFILAAVASAFGGLVRGWVLLAAAAIGANLITAFVHTHEQTQSLGASTAVFAGIGLLAGQAVRWGGRAHRLVRVRATLLPLAAGIVLLGLLGGGGPHVDLVAHAAGFLTGLVAGFIAAQPASRQS